VSLSNGRTVERSKHERDESSISPLSAMLRTGFGKLKASGNSSL
jgi:hypothetical protein